MALRLKYENSFSLMNHAANWMETYPDSRPGESVVLLGDPNDSGYGSSKEQDFRAFLRMWALAAPMITA